MRIKISDAILLKKYKHRLLNIKIPLDMKLLINFMVILASDVKVVIFLRDFNINKQR
jgi:hypothetical protein